MGLVPIFSLEAVSTLARSCGGSLVRLNLTGASWLTYEGLSAIATSCVAIEALLLSGCSGIRDTGLSAVAAGCVQLKEVDLSNCRRVTECGVAALAGLAHVEHLELSNCAGATDESLLAFAPRAKGLRYLGLRKCVALSDVGLCRLIEGCSSLAHLNVSECREAITDETLDAIGVHCRALHTLDMSGSDECTEAGLVSLVHGCGQLERLAVEGCDALTDVAARAIAVHLPRLRWLHRSGCERLSYGVLVQLHHVHPAFALN